MRAALLLAVLIGCAAPCPDSDCKGTITLTIEKVVGELLHNDAYEAIVCIQGLCQEATFKLPPEQGGCDAGVVSDGSLCCRTSWPAQTSTDCRAAGDALQLTLPLRQGNIATRKQAVVLTLIDSEGDETLRDETYELEPADPTCASDCRHVRVTF